MEQGPDISRRRLAIAAMGSALTGIAVPTATPAAATRRAATHVPADDKLSIIELMARYAWAYDTSDVAGFTQTFTADGIIEIFGNVLVRGWHDVPAFLATAYEMRKGNGWQHLTDHHVFEEYDGKRCTVYSYYLMPEGDPSGSNVHLRAMGYYVSRCVKIGNDWLFSKRSVFRWNGKKPWAEQPSG